MAASARPCRKHVDEYMEGGSAAELAVGSGCCRLAFYNIAWDKKAKRHDMERLAKEISNISEVFNLRDDVSDLLRFGHDQQIIMQHLLSSLHGSAERPASYGSAAQPAHSGHPDEHWEGIWNTKRLRLFVYEYLRCGTAEHSCRKAQYFQFEHPEPVVASSGSAVQHVRNQQQGPPLRIYHNHSPSSDTANYSVRKQKKAHLLDFLVPSVENKFYCAACRIVCWRLQLP